jgi:hypothetical protein
MASTPTGLFGLLPNEVLFILLDLLPITDVLSLKWATYSLLQVLESRVDLVQYFQDKGPFVDASDLLETMSKHGAVLSGSRALDWFVPRSATIASDWDFYVPPEPTAIASVKRALERSGVSFETCLTQAARKLQSEFSVSLNRNQLVSIAYEGYLHSNSWQCNENIVLEAVYRTYPVLRDISPYMQPDGSLSWIVDLLPISIRRDGISINRNGISSGVQEGIQEDNCYDHVAPTVLSGTAQKFDRTVSVQLVVGALDPRRQWAAEPAPLFQSVLRSVFRFYGSHVQCILTKHAAVHMYYELAIEKMAYQWQVPEVIRDRADAAVQKYMRRGFQFMTAPEDEDMCRTALDDGSCFIVLENNNDCFPSLSLLKELEWSHNGNTIRPCAGPTTREARRELLYFGIVHRI